MDTQDYLDMYYQNNARRLRQMVNGILKHFGGITDREHFYSIANEVFSYVLKRYDGVHDFDKYLYGCLYNRIKTDFTMQDRKKRCQYARDNNGKRIKDKNGEYIRIHPLRLDACIGEDNNLVIGDMIASDFDIDKEAFLQDDNSENDTDDNSDKVERYFERLSERQKRIVTLLVESYNPDEIMAILHIDKDEYKSDMTNIKAYRNVSILY